MYALNLKETTNNVVNVWLRNEYKTMRVKYKTMNVL